MLSLSMLLTFYSFTTNAMAANSQNEASTPVTFDTKLPTLRTPNNTPTFSDDDIKSCLENTEKLEKIQRSRENSVKVLDWWTEVLQDHVKQKEIIKGRIEYFQSECDYYESLPDDNKVAFYENSCRTVDHHIEVLRKEYRAELETKLEVVEEITKAVGLKRQEEEHRLTFDLNCQEAKYGKEQVLKICRKFYSYEYPICRDFM